MINKGIISRNFSFIVAIIVALFVFLGIRLHLVSGYETSLLYLSSAVLQAYATLIAVPFAIAAVHMQSRYGYVSTRVLLKVLIPVLKWYLFILLVSVLSIVFASAEGTIVQAFLVVEVLIALAPLSYFAKHVREILLIKPSDILRELGFPERIVKLFRDGRLFDVQEFLTQGFLLAKGCLLEPALYTEAEKVLSQISVALREIDWSMEVAERRNNIVFDVSMLLSGIIRHIRADIVDPIVISPLKPHPEALMRLMWVVCEAFMTLMRDSYFYSFDKFLDLVHRLTMSYVDVDLESALEIYKTILDNVRGWHKRSYEVKDESRINLLAEKVIPRAFCVGISIFNEVFVAKARSGKIEGSIEMLKLDAFLCTILKTIEESPCSIFHIFCEGELEDAIRNCTKITYINVFNFLKIMALCYRERNNMPDYMTQRVQYILETFSNLLTELMEEGNIKVRISNDRLVISGGRGEVSGELENGMKNVVKDYLEFLKRKV
ncbi:MAG: hypothetical protein ACTSXX_12390 [Candidatus Baldrarchaeia archaeon]